MTKQYGRSAALSHIGRVREENQDAFVRSDSRGIWAVADGVGGNVGGAVASRLVVGSLAGMPAVSTRSRCDIEGAFRRASQSIADRGRKTRELYYMASTAVMLTVADNALYVAHSGDSRCYRLRNKLEQLTKDHSTGDGRLYHAVDSRKPDVEIARVDSRRGDRFLLCSDGLTNYARIEEIWAALQHGNDPKEVCDRLVSIALSGEGGGGDNVTVLVLDVA